MLRTNICMGGSTDWGCSCGSLRLSDENFKGMYAYYAMVDVVLQRAWSHTPTVS